jgi:adenosylcobinamide-GDP ribazoletransferase
MYRSTTKRVDTTNSALANPAKLDRTPDRRHPVSAGLSRLAADVMISLIFCTRLPVGGVDMGTRADAGGMLARASWALPLAGLLVGGAGALVYWAAVRIGVPTGPGAALVLVTTMLATGCLHEDGLADTADGFGGGGDRDHKLSIMRDSHIGTYGTAALAMSILLRWSALASIAAPAAVAFALVAAHGAARGALPVFMRAMPQARPAGLSVAAGRPPSSRAVAAAALGAAMLLLCLGLTAGLLGVALLTATGWLMGRLALRQVGGQTGDVLGALEQVNEIIVLLIAAAASKAAP